MPRAPSPALETKMLHYCTDWCACNAVGTARQQCEDRNLADPQNKLLIEAYSMYEQMVILPNDV